MDPHQIGVYSETVAVYYLQRLGYTLIARNYRCRYGEIDSVFLDGEVLVFVEVKHIGKVGADSLSFQIDRRKRAKIVAAANDFLFSHPEKRNLLIRFDVVAILVDIRSIRHFKNAFEENALL